MMIKVIFGLLVMCCAFSQAREWEQERFVEVDEGEIYCRILGEGEPLIIINGGPGLDHSYFLPHLEQLAAHYQLIFYDQRGCGRSSGGESEELLTIDQFVDDLEALRVALGLGKIHILGHSWGGILAMHYGVCYPENLASLVLLNTGPASIEGLEDFWYEVGRRMEPYREKIEVMESSEAFQNGDPEVVVPYTQLIFSLYLKEPQVVEKLNFHLTPETIPKQRQVFSAIKANFFAHPFDWHPVLKQIHCPVLVVHGDADPIPEQTARRIHESIPSSVYVLLENCGHFPFVEKPQECMEVLEAFFSKVVT